MNDFFDWFLGPARLKHLGGQHDQSTHGNRYGVTGGEAAMLVRQAHEQGGFSYRHGKGSPTTGYTVSLPGYELRQPLASVTREDIIKYINEHKKVLKQFPKAFWGGWVSEDTLCLDISENYDSQADAERAGRERNQDAIWDVANGVEIRLKERDMTKDTHEKAKTKKIQFAFGRDASAEEIADALMALKAEVLGQSVEDKTDTDKPKSGESSPK